MDINYHAHELIVLLNNIIKEHVPKILIETGRFPKWFSHELINSIIIKKKLHKLFKIHNTEFFYSMFKIERTLCSRLSARDTLHYNSDIEKSLSENSKIFFKHVNNLTCNRNLPNVMHLDNEIAEKGLDIANLFAKKFGSVYTDLDLSSTTIDFNHNDSFSSIIFSKRDIENAIFQLNNCSAPGPDNIHPFFVKSCYRVFVPYLTKLFNFSIRCGIFPDIWKKSFITPLFKNGDKTNINNYRPIMKPSVFANLNNMLVCEVISPYIFKFIVALQHGFLPKKSTQTNLCTYMDYLTDSISNKFTVDSIYTDFKRAFDVVNVNLLIRKLSAYGFNGSLLSWLSSFLSNRTQRVKIKCYLSEIISVTSSVPQGSHLGPVLFLLFINDICYIILFSKYLLFADDMKLYLRIASFNDKLLLQSDLDRLQLWCIKNGFECNIKKCFIITFGKNYEDDYKYTLNNSELERVYIIKDLGVYFDSKLTFQQHIEYVSSKATKQVNFIKRFSGDFKEPNTFRTLYFSFVYPILSYCSVIWRPQFNFLKEMLDKPRRKLLRFSAYKCGTPMHYTDHDYSSISKFLKIPNIESSHIRNDLIFGFKILNGSINCPELLSSFEFYVPPRTLRNQFYFYEREYKFSSPIKRLSKLFNKQSKQFNLYNTSNYSFSKITKSSFVYK